MTDALTAARGPRRARLLWLGALATAAVCGVSESPAQAQRVSVIGRAPPDAPAGAADASAALSAAAQRDGAVVVAAPFARATGRVAKGAVVASRLEGFRRARQLTREGWRAYLAVEAGFAASRLAEARRVAGRIVDLPGGLTLYADLSLRLGVVLLHLQRATEAAVLFRLVHRLEPARLVTEADYTPAVVKAYKAAAVALPHAPVVVRASVPGAAVEIDGKQVGTSPLRVSLEQGQHVVVVRTAGFAPTPATVVVGPTTTRVDMTMERDALVQALRAGDSSLALGTGEADAGRAMEALVTYGELDGVVLTAVVWRRGAPALLGQLCRGVPVRCSSVVEIGYPSGEAMAKAAGALWEAMTRPGMRHRFPPTLLGDARVTRGEARPGVAGTNGGARVAWWKNSWLWAGVGVVTVAVGAVVLLRGETETRPVVSVDPCDFGGCP